MALRRKLLLKDKIAFAESRFDITDVHLKIRCNVIRRGFMQLRCAGLNADARISNGWKRLVFNIDLFKRVFGKTPIPLR